VTRDHAAACDRAFMTATVNFLAIDLGASNGRGFLGRWDGNRFSLEELHRFPNGPVTLFGHQHWDVLRLWTEIKTVIGYCGRRFDAPLAGLGVDTWGVDFALLDAQGNLLGNPYHYRDPRTNGMMELLFQRIPRRRVFEQTGIQVMQYNTLYQLFSMIHDHDPLLQAADTLLMMPDLFHYWLTGRKACEFTDASTSQMFDVPRNRWAVDMLAQLEIPAHVLPEVVSPGTVLGPLSDALAAELGLREPVAVIATGSHDTASAIAAIPGLDAESAYICSGTWSLMGAEIENPLVSDQAFTLNFTNEGGVGNRLNLLKNLTGLWLLQESRRSWQRVGHDYSWDELLSLGEKAEPFRSFIHPDSPEFLNPAHMIDAIRNFCRRTGQAEPSSVGAVVRCCLENLALNYRRVLDELETLTGRRVKTIRIVGGGSRNHLLSQFTADACRRPVVAGPVEATALGNVLLQAIATGHLSDVPSGREAIAASVHPRHFEPGAGDIWEEAYGRFMNLK
jgi:rhamnulokinase